MERRLDALTAKVVELGRRFHSSDVAFPLRTFRLPQLASFFL